MHEASSVLHVPLRSGADPVLYLNDPDGVDRGRRRRMLDAIARLNAERASEVGDPEIRARIEQYEMAFRMLVRTQRPRMTHRAPSSHSSRPSRSRTASPWAQTPVAGFPVCANQPWTSALGPKQFQILLH